MFLKKRNKTKQNDEEKRNSVLRRESSPRPLACMGKAISIAPRWLTIRSSFQLIISNIFLPMKFCRWTLYKKTRLKCSWFCWFRACLWSLVSRLLYTMNSLSSGFVFGFLHYRNIRPRARQLEGELWVRPQFLDTRVPPDGWEWDGWLPCAPFHLFWLDLS